MFAILPGQPRQRTLQSEIEELGHPRIVKSPLTITFFHSNTQLLLTELSMLAAQMRQSIIVGPFPAFEIFIRLI